MKNLSFSTEIEINKQELERTRKELEQLKLAYNQFDVKTQTLQSIINELSQLEKGEMPHKTKKGSRSGALSVNEETGRPNRGARRDQVKDICKELAKTKDTFKTVEILRELKAREEELTPGMKSYTYAVMNTLEKDQFVEKVGRALWKLL